MGLRTTLLATSFVAGLSLAGMSVATAQGMQGSMGGMMRGDMGSSMMGKSQENHSTAPSSDSSKSAPMCSAGSCPCMQGGSGMMCGEMMQGHMGINMMGHMQSGMMDRMRSSTMHRGMMEKDTQSEDNKPFGSYVAPTMNLSVDDVRNYLTTRLEKINNKRLKLGDMKADGASITADVVTVDNSLVQRLKVDRHTGEIEYEN